MSEELKNKVLQDKYLLRDANNNLLEHNENEIWERVATAISSVEETTIRKKWQKQFYWLMEHWKFIPGGRILFGAGNKGRKLTMLNCYALPITADSITGIYNCLAETSKTLAYGGGVGIDMSIIRPSRALVATSSLNSSGVVPFVELFSHTAGLIGQHGRCLDGNTRILTKDGLLKISDVVKTRYCGEVWTEYGWKKIINWFSNGKKNLVKVVTKRGIELCATVDHNISICYNGDTKLSRIGDVKIGDDVVSLIGEYSSNNKYVLLDVSKKIYKKSSRVNYSINLPKTLDEKLAYWLGVYYGDGGHDVRVHGFEIVFGINEISQCNYFDSITYDLFNIKCKKRDTKDNTLRLRFQSIIVKDFLVANGLYKEKSGAILVPDKVFESPHTVRAAFIAGYFDADGSVHSRKSAKRQSVTICSSSNEFLCGLQKLLLSVGVAFRRCGKHNISASGLVSIRNFRDSCGVYSIKFSKYKYENKVDFNMTPFIASKLKMKTYVNGKYMTACGNFMSLRVAEQYFMLGMTKGRRIDKVVSDEVINIFEVGVADTYDITVEGTHKFWANGFYVSNSGALILTLHCNHPDIFEFIKSKADVTKKTIKFANISVLATDKLMNAIRVDGDFELWYPDKAEGELNKTIVETIETARKLIEEPGKILDEFRNGILWFTNYKLIKQIKDIFAEKKIAFIYNGFEQFYNYDTYEWFVFYSGISDEWEVRKKKQYSIIKAKDLWGALIEHARNSAEPGVIFYDSLRKFSTSEYNGMEVLVTNPCVSGDTRFHTQHGLVRIKDLYELRADIIATCDSRTFGFVRKFGTFKAKCKPVFITDKCADIFEVTTRKGYKIKATKWHEFYTVDNKIVKKLKLSDMKSGDKLLLQSGVGQFGVDGSYNLGMLIGWITGDGFISGNRAYIDLYNDDMSLANKFSQAVKEVINELYKYTDVRKCSVSKKETNTFCKPFIHSSLRKNCISKKIRLSSLRLGRILRYLYNFDSSTKLRVPEIIFRGKKQTVIGYLSALFAADGSVLHGSKKQQEYNQLAIHLYSKSKKLLEDVQILLSNFGIVSAICICQRGKELKADNGKIYNSSDCYRLYMLHCDSIKFIKEIGFIGNKHKRAIKIINNRIDLNDPMRLLRRNIDEIVSIKYVGAEVVYDTTQLVNHSLIFNGLVTGNCSEVSIGAYGACCLGSINLSSVVVHEFTDDAHVDYELFDKLIRTGVRFLDNVLDYSANMHPIKLQSLSSMQGRRIGLGITGLADMLCKLKLSYNSKEAIDMVEKVFKFMHEKAYDASNQIAEEKQSFPAFDAKIHFAQKFYDGDAVIQQYKKLRNVALLSMPPVGSGSLLSMTSSGIEPIYAISYTRKSESLAKKEFKIYHPLAQECMKKLNLKKESELPSYFVVADKIDYKFRVLMQSTIQKYVCQSISSTTNVVNDTTIDVVNDIYTLAWDSGCKGITVYRQGSREDILSVGGSSGIVPKLGRPKIAHGDTLKIKLSDLCTVYVTLNYNDDKTPLEVFLNLGKSGSDERAMTEALGRVISLYLQSGGNLTQIIETLLNIRGSSISWWEGTAVYSLPDGVAKALMIMYNSEVSVVDACPKCRQISLKYENGCWICNNCAFTKCS